MGDFFLRVGVCVFFWSRLAELLLCGCLWFDSIDKVRFLASCGEFRFDSEKAEREEFVQALLVFDAMWELALNLCN